MSKPPTISVCETAKGWRVRTPPSLSPTGRERSQFFKDRPEADRKAKRIRLELASYGKAAPTERELIAITIARSKGIDLGQFVAALEEKDQYASTDLIAVSQLKSQFLTHHIEIQKSGPRHISSLKSRLGMFEEVYGGSAAGSISPQDVNLYLDKIKNPQTRQGHYLNLLQLFNFGVKRGLLEKNPMRLPGRSIDRPRVPYSPPQILSVPEAEKLLRAAAGPVRAFLTLACFAGLRSCEMSSCTTARPVLLWGDVRWADGHIHIRREIAKRTRKRDNERWVPITDALRTWLEPLRGKDGDRVIAYPESYLYEDLRTLAVKEGLKGWPSNAPRHSFASYFLAAYPERGAGELAQLMGNSEQVARQHYVRAIPKEVGAAYFQIRP